MDSDEGNGELTIFIPPSLQQEDQNPTTTTNEVNSNVNEVVYKVTIDFALEHPENGIHFFVPDDDAKISRVSGNVYQKIQLSILKIAQLSSIHHW